MKFLPRKVFVKLVDCECGDVKAREYEPLLALPKKGDIYDVSYECQDDLAEAVSDCWERHKCEDCPDKPYRTLGSTKDYAINVNDSIYVQDFKTNGEVATIELTKHEIL